MELAHMGVYNYELGIAKNVMACETMLFQVMKAQ
jgi:hypothetical protein